MTLRSRAVAALAVCAAGSVAAACQDGGNNVRPRVFERPGDVAFACFEPETRLPVPLAECTSQRDLDTATEGVHALVTQTARGEVAPVDLRSDEDGSVIDLDRRIPGFTFLPVGAQPTAIAVSPTAPETTYVASLGSREVLAIETSRFRRDAEDGPPGNRPPQVVARLPLPAGPTDMALVETGDIRALLVALPVASQVRWVVLEDDGTFGAEGAIALATNAGPPTTADPAALVDYCRVCPLREPTEDEPCAGLDPIPVVPARDPVSRGDTPRPVALDVDEEGTIYVADANLPLLHVVTVDGLGTPPVFVDTPIPVAVPTSEVAVTPPVPARVGDTEATERYVYAVDATDGSVLVADVGLGAVLPISNAPATAPDRVPTLSAATTLEVLTPDYDPGDVQLCDLGEALAEDRVVHPRRARGVFLAVGLTTGVVRFVDVLDLDATCRGGDASCAGAIEDDDVFVAIRRHLPRSGEWWDDPVEVGDAPTLREDTRTTRIGEDGRPRSGRALWLDPLPEDCGGSQDRIHRQVYPPAPTLGEEPAPPLICTRDDPFVIGTEQWQLEWEGTLPGTLGGRGRVVDDAADTAILDAPLPDGAPEVRFCDRGVIGPVADDGGVLAGYGGDLLSIRGPLPPASRDLPGCEDTFLDEDGVLLRVDFPILESFQDRLVVARTSRPLGGTGPQVDLDEVRRCFPGAVRYQVRAGLSFRVFGSSTLFLHPIVAGADGRCEVDEARPLDVGRARAGRTFDNGQIVFALTAPGDPGPRTLGPAEEVFLDFAVEDQTPKLRIVLGAQGLPTAVRWLDPAQRLFVVDQGGAALQEYRFDDQTTSFRSGELRSASGRVFN